MPDPTFAEQMLAKYQQLLLANAGLQSANVDGQTITLRDLEEKWEYWTKMVAIEQGRRPRISTIKLG